MDIPMIDGANKPVLSAKQMLDQEAENGYVEPTAELLVRGATHRLFWLRDLKREGRNP